MSPNKDETGLGMLADLIAKEYCRVKTFAQAVLLKRGFVGEDYEEML